MKNRLGRIIVLASLAIPIVAEAFIFQTPEEVLESNSEAIVIVRVRSIVVKDVYVTLAATNDMLTLPEMPPPWCSLSYGEQTSNGISHYSWSRNVLCTNSYPKVTDTAGTIVYLEHLKRMLEKVDSIGWYAVDRIHTEIFNYFAEVVAECRVDTILKGSISNDVIYVNLPQYFSYGGDLSPFELKQKKKYILWLVRKDNQYFMVDTVQGAKEVSKDYEVSTLDDHSQRQIKHSAYLELIKRIAKDGMLTQ